MCLILFAWQQHHAYPLIVAANRDEFYARPSEGAAFWPVAPQVLAGRDLSGGGTWLGVTRDGRFAALTNVREPQRPYPGGMSRGALVSGFLEGKDSAQNYAAQVQEKGEQFAGFNLLLGDGASLYCVSNRADVPRSLSPGIYGLSNHQLDTPWPKVQRGKRQLASLLPGVTTAALIAMLQDDTLAEDIALPSTGVGLEMERMLSAMLIRSPVYGTRSSTALLLGNTCEFSEQNYREKGELAEKRNYVFAVDFS